MLGDGEGLHCCVVGSSCRKGVTIATAGALLRDTAKAEPVTRAQARGHLAGLDFELG